MRVFLRRPAHPVALPLGWRPGMPAAVMLLGQRDEVVDVETSGIGEHAPRVGGLPAARDTLRNLILPTSIEASPSTHYPSWGSETLSCHL